MDLQPNIEIGIGSRVAKAGAAKVRAALESIKRKSRQVAASAQKDSASMRRGYGGFIKMFAALGGAVALKGVISSTKDFGQAVADLSAITGATGEDLEYLRQKSMEFGATTSLSASQAAEAFKVIASAKPDLLENSQALAKVTEEAIALAEATGEDLPSAANVMASALNQFGKGADESSRFINVLAAGSKRGAALVGEMGESLKAVGVIASQAGIDFEETNAALQLMSTRAIKGSEAGMQFRGMLLALTSQSRDEFKPEVVGLQTALENLASAGLDEGADSVKLFGRRNLAVAKTLIQNRDQLGKLTEQLTGTNIAYEQQATRMNTLEGDSLALKSAYEGLELVIGQAGLEGSLRAMTQAATENIRKLSQSPLLRKGVTATLDTIHRIIQDIGLAWDQWTDIVVKSSGGGAVWEGVWSGAIQNIIKWTKFLWDQFVIGGPANLKLGITLMIAAFDRLRISVTEKVRVLTIGMLGSFSEFSANVVGIFNAIGPTIHLVFIKMAHAIKQTFNNIRVTIADAIDNLIGLVQQKVFTVARTLANLGFDDRAREIVDVGIAIGKLATNGEAARKAAEANATARQAELDAAIAVLEAIRVEKETKIRLARETADALIKETLDIAEAQRLQSMAAVQGAIAERDATLQAIEALRTKRAEIASGGSGTPEPDKLPTETDLSEPADAAASAYESLGETAKTIVDGMSDGIADMAASGTASFREMAANIIQEIIRIYIKSQILNALSSIFGGFGQTAAQVPASGAGITVGPPARTGSEFKVGGSGGMDSQLVAFKASPGEHVSVKTPKQQEASGRGGGGVTIHQSNVIDARGADAERIEAMLPALLEQSRQKTIREVLTLRDKGMLRL